MFFKKFIIAIIFCTIQIHCSIDSLNQEFYVLKNIEKLGDVDKEHILFFINPEIKILSEDITSQIILQKLYNILNHQTVTIQHDFNPKLKIIIDKGLKTEFEHQKDIIFFKTMVALLKEYTPSFLLLEPNQTLEEKALQIKSTSDNDMKILLFMMLIAQGFDPNTTLNESNQTLLMIILSDKTEFQIYELFFLFLSTGLNLYHEDTRHTSLVAFICYNNYHDFIKILLDNGLNINYIYSNNQNLIDFMVSKIFHIIKNIYIKFPEVKKRYSALLNTTFHLDIRFLHEWIKLGASPEHSIALLQNILTQPENLYLQDKPYLIKRLMSIINPESLETV